MLYSIVIHLSSIFGLSNAYTEPLFAFAMAVLRMVMSVYLFNFNDNAEHSADAQLFRSALYTWSTSRSSGGANERCKSVV